MEHKNTKIIIRHYKISNSKIDFKFHIIGSWSQGRATWCGRAYCSACAHCLRVAPHLNPVDTTPIWVLRLARGNTIHGQFDTHGGTL